MVKLYAAAQAYLTNEEGATAIEYGLIAAGISLVIATTVFLFGEDLDALFGDMSTALEGAGE